MIRNIGLFLLGLSIASCSAPEPEPKADQELSALDNAAIDAGLITDPDQLDLQGVYETRSALGTDRFCAIGNRDAGYEIGVLAVFGRDSQCEARGRATINGDELQIELNEHPEGEVSGAEGEAIKACQFTAFFDGTVVRLPGELPKVCDSICSDRASFAGVNFQLVEQGLPAATRTRGRGFKRLCAVR